MSEAKVLDKKSSSTRPVDVEVFTIATTFPELQDVVAATRHTGKPLDITLIPAYRVSEQWSSREDTPRYANAFVARFIDGWGIDEDKPIDARFHFADPELATMAIANGYQPRSQAQFDVVYCPTGVVRTGHGSLPKTRNYPNGYYEIPNMMYLESQACVTTELNQIYGEGTWVVVPIAFEHERPGSPNVGSVNSGFFIRCAVLVKR